MKKKGNKKMPTPGLTEEEDDEEYDDPKIVKSRMSGFSRGKLEAGRNELGYVQLESSPKVVAVCFQGLARRSHGVRRRFVPGSHEISRVSSLHIASTDALIYTLSSMQHVFNG